MRDAGRHRLDAGLVERRDHLFRAAPGWRCRCRRSPRRAARRARSRRQSAPRCRPRSAPPAAPGRRPRRIQAAARCGVTGFGRGSMWPGHDRGRSPSAAARRRPGVDGAEMDGHDDQHERQQHRRRSPPSQTHGSACQPRHRRRRFATSRSQPQPQQVEHGRQDQRQDDREQTRGASRASICQHLGEIDQHAGGRAPDVAALIGQHEEAAALRPADSRSTRWWLRRSRMKASGTSKTSATSNGSIASAKGGATRPTIGVISKPVPVT